MPEHNGGRAATTGPGRAGQPQLPQRDQTKTVLTEIGPVQIDVPRNRDARNPVIMGKRQHRLDGIDGIVLSLNRPTA